MNNSEIRIFYSWQSDLPNNETRGLIQEGISSAVKMLRDTVEIEADRDTKGEFGSPDIVQTIFSKIDECDIFIADVSIVNKYHSITDEGEAGSVKLGPNPNVMLELGYAAGVVGWENVICFLNIDYGSPDELPFDLEHRRLSPYSLKGKTRADVRKYIRDIVVDTVSNLLENGPRVKNQFANIVIGHYDPESNVISKNLIPYEPAEYFDAYLKKRFITECKGLIEDINAIHLEPCVTGKPIDSRTMPANGNEITEKVRFKSSISQRVTVKESDRQSILKFVGENPGMELSADFFELGNLEKMVQFHLAGGGPTYKGSEEEKEKHDKINSLIDKIAQMEMMETYSKTFDRYLLFPLAIRNISTIADEEISISVIVENSSPVFPSRKIINPDLQGNEGIIYEEDIIREFLLMPENSLIKYDSDISYSGEDDYDLVKLHGLNGAHYDEEDYERELSKYIAIPRGIDKSEYEFYISSMRPKETCWLGPMIMVGRDSQEITIRYSIKSNKSDGDLSGVLQY